MENHTSRIRLAIQKSGRLSERAFSILKRCGLEFEQNSTQLTWVVQNFPLDIMLVRNSDIPEYVRDGVCDLGVVGENVLEELRPEEPNGTWVDCIMRLGFGRCHLAIAVPKEYEFKTIKDLHGMRFATSYPNTLKRFFEKSGIEGEVINISGSVELSPKLKIADVICDLVSTGGTLRSNGLKEVLTVLESECALVKTQKSLSAEKENEISRLEQRLTGVLKAESTKYVMMHAPTSSLSAIRELIPGMENPTIMNLEGRDDQVALHAVSKENIFWETMEKLKALGASSILVLPIEKIIE